MPEIYLVESVFDKNNVITFYSSFLPASPKAEAGLGIAFSVRPSKAVLT